MLIKNAILNLVASYRENKNGYRRNVYDYKRHSNTKSMPVIIYDACTIIGHSIS